MAAGVPAFAVISTCTADVPDVAEGPEICPILPEARPKASTIRFSHFQT
jgi:hypothetical protein